MNGYGIIIRGILPNILWVSYLYPYYIHEDVSISMESVLKQWINKEIKTEYLDDGGSGVKSKYCFSKTGIRSHFGYDQIH